MMSELDRQKVFWLLKKYSSYTAWKALGDAYAEFSDAYWKAVELSYDDNPDDGEWELSRAKQLLDGKVAFEKGLPLLKQGDRQVFRKNARGELNKASTAINFAWKIMGPDFIFDWMKNKDEVFSKYSHMLKIKMRTPSVCEPPEERNICGGSYVIFGSSSEPYNYPSSLPVVPEATSVIVQTDDEVSFDGIYEPEWSIADFSEKNWLENLKHIASEKKVANVGKGRMTYLVSGRKAPSYNDNELDKPMPVIWRLIWKDERYLDGTIPDEEADYLKPIENTSPQQLRCEANQPCPKTGYWWTPAKENSRRHFKQGEIMPDFPNSSYGATIWQWDVNQ